MSSLKSTNTGASVFRNSGSPVYPALSGNWTQTCWIKLASYGSGQGLLFGGGGGNFGYEFRTGDGTIGSAGEMVVRYLASNATVDTEVLLTGSDTAWVFVALTHASAAGTITVYWRKENVGTLSSGTLTATGIGSVGACDLGLIYEGANGNTHGAMHFRSHKAWTRALSSADVLAESALLDTLDSSTNIFSFLLGTEDPNFVNPLPDQGGLGNDWTVNSTLTRESDEPDETLPAGGAAGLVLPSSQQYRMRRTSIYRR